MAQDIPYRCGKCDAPNIYIPKDAKLMTPLLESQGATSSKPYYIATCAKCGARNKVYPFPKGSP